MNVSGGHGLLPAVCDPTSDIYNGLGCCARATAAASQAEEILNDVGASSHAHSKCCPPHASKKRPHSAQLSSHTAAQLQQHQDGASASAAHAAEPSAGADALLGQPGGAHSQQFRVDGLTPGLCMLADLAQQLLEPQLAQLQQQTAGESVQQAKEQEQQARPQQQERLQDGVKHVQGTQPAEQVHQKRQHERRVSSSEDSAVTSAVASTVEEGPAVKKQRVGSSPAPASPQAQLGAPQQTQKAPDATATQQKARDNAHPIPAEPDQPQQLQQQQQQQHEAKHELEGASQAAEAPAAHDVNAALSAAAAAAAAGAAAAAAAAVGSEAALEVGMALEASGVDPSRSELPQGPLHPWEAARQAEMSRLQRQLARLQGLQADLAVLGSRKQKPSAQPVSAATTTTTTAAAAAAATPDATQAAVGTSAAGAAAAGSSPSRASPQQVAGDLLSAAYSSSAAAGSVAPHQRAWPPAGAAAMWPRPAWPGPYVSPMTGYPALPPYTAAMAPYAGMRPGLGIAPQQRLGAPVEYAEGWAAGGGMAHKYTGVYPSRRAETGWRAQFAYANKVVNLGTFDTAADAARVWNAAAMLFRGTNTYLNPVTPLLPEGHQAGELLLDSEKAVEACKRLARTAGVKEDVIAGIKVKP